MPLRYYPGNPNQVGTTTQGPQGLAGPAGNQGPQGPTGLQGPQGESGGLFQIKGKIANATFLPEDNNEVGDSWFNDDDQLVYIWNGEDWESTPVGGIPGLEGPVGTTGNTGPVGLKGLVGAVGPRGEAGTNLTVGLSAREKRPAIVGITPQDHPQPGQPFIIHNNYASFGYTGGAAGSRLRVSETHAICYPFNFETGTWNPTTIFLNFTENYTANETTNYNSWRISAALYSDQELLFSDETGNNGYPKIVWTSGNRVRTSVPYKRIKNFNEVTITNALANQGVLLTSNTNELIQSGQVYWVVLKLEPWNQTLTYHYYQTVQNLGDLPSIVTVANPTLLPPSGSANTIYYSTSNTTYYVWSNGSYSTPIPTDSLWYIKTGNQLRLLSGGAFSVVGTNILQTNYNTRVPITYLPKFESSYGSASNFTPWGANGIALELYGEVLLTDPSGDLLFKDGYYDRYWNYVNYENPFIPSNTMLKNVSSSTAPQINLGFGPLP